MKKPTADEVLQCPIHWRHGKDTGADTVEDYLITLLLEVVKWQDVFDGKRPFGNSDWLVNDIGYSLAIEDLIDSQPDIYGELDFNYGAVEEAVYDAVEGIKENLHRLRGLDDS